jgi:AbrB family looped-hinge helix DNA binding protein
MSHDRGLVPDRYEAGYDGCMSAPERETATVDERGRLVVPSAWRAALGLRPGDSVLLETDGHEIRVVNARRERAAVAARLRGSVTGGESVDELLAARRVDAARDETS